MKTEKKNIKQIMLLILFAGLVLWISQNYKIFINLLKFVVDLIMPIIIGGIIAFIINVPMKSLEKKVFKIDKRKHKKLIRVLSLILSILFIFGVIGLLMFLVIPEFIEAIITIGKTVPINTNFINESISKLENVYPSISTYLKDINVESIVKTTIGTTGSVVTIMISMLTGFISKIVTFFIGFVLAIYILFDKEKLTRQIKKLMYAFLASKTVKKVIKIFKLTNTTFTNFLTGQCLDAIVLGILFFVTMSILRMPYALIISVLLSVTALIPYIGAFITLVIGVVLIGVTYPIKALWFIVMFFILQQIDENILIPKIVGKSVGLPALWTLIAALIGGSMFGLVGIIISIPISSVLYTLLKDYVNEKNKK